MLFLSCLALIALAALPLRQAGSDSSPIATAPLLPPTAIVIGETPPAAVEPGVYAADAIGFRVNGAQTGMEDVRLATRCGAARLEAVTIAADGSFGAAVASGRIRLSVKGRFVRPDIAYGIARVQTRGCDSGGVPFSARLHPR